MEYDTLIAEGQLNVTGNERGELQQNVAKKTLREPLGPLVEKMKMTGLTLLHKFGTASKI